MEYINNAFRHVGWMYSQDGGLERIEARAEASCVASIINFVEPNRVIPYMLLNIIIMLEFLNREILTVCDLSYYVSHCFPGALATCHVLAAMLFIVIVVAFSPVVVA